jgi:hypothetical protein
MDAHTEPPTPNNEGPGDPVTNYVPPLQAAGPDPAQWETIYQAALRTRTTRSFEDAVEAVYAEQPGNLLYAAWHYRLAAAAQTAAANPTAANPAAAHQVPWLFALLLAFANGFLLWLLSDTDNLMLQVQGSSVMPYFVLLWAPLAALFILAYLARTGALNWRTWGLLAAGLALTAGCGLLGYTLLGTPAFQEQYLILAALHIPLVAWTLVGLGLLPGPVGHGASSSPPGAGDRAAGLSSLPGADAKIAGRSSLAERDSHGARASSLPGFGDGEGRFAFLLKSLELFVLGGLFLSALGVLTLVTFALFQALGIDLPVLAQRLLIAGGAGLIPVLVVALAYDPARAPGEQSFERGLSRLLAQLLRLFLPLTLAVLAVYLCFVPFYFWRPFADRDVLITYNAMLFAVMALLLGVTPYTVADLSPAQARWLRRGIVAVAALAAVVSLYALAAIGYRTVQEGLTPNRVTFIGWNIINTALLVYLLVKQAAANAGRNADRWLPPLHAAFGLGALLYALWSALVLFGLPWLF